MGKLIYNPIISHAISSFGVNSPRAKGVMDFLNLPGINPDRARMIRFPQNDIIVQHGAEAYSTMPSEIKPEQMRAAAPAPVLEHPFLRGNVLMRTDNGFTTFDHGGFIISPVGVTQSGQIDTRMIGDTPLGHPINLAIANASRGAIPYTDAAEHILHRRDLTPLMDSIGLKSISNPNDFEYGVKKEMGHGIVIAETGRFDDESNPENVRSAVGQAMGLPQGMDIPQRPVAIWDGRQVVPHPSEMIRWAYRYHEDSEPAARQMARWDTEREMMEAMGDDDPDLFINYDEAIDEDGFIRLAPSYVRAYVPKEKWREMQSHEYRNMAEQLYYDREGHWPGEGPDD